MTDNDGGGASDEATADSLRDRRRHERVDVQLQGRYMLEDGSEHACVCLDVSVGGVRLRGAASGPWGSRVIAYIESIGRLEGYIVRRAPGWFALEARGSARKEERVQERIATILEARGQESRPRRRVPRERARREVGLHTLDGRRHEAQLTDISREGAALLTDAPLAIDERVRLDARRARVMRLFPGGAAIRFENWVDETWPPREAPAPESPPRVRRA